MSIHVANHKIRGRYALRENQHMRGNPPNRSYSLDNFILQKVLWIKRHFVTQFSLTDHYFKIRKISSFMPISLPKLRLKLSETSI